MMNIGLTKLVLELSKELLEKHSIAEAEEIVAITMRMVTPLLELPERKKKAYSKSIKMMLSMMLSRITETAWGQKGGK